MSMKPIGILIALTLTTPALAQSESDYQEQLCAGMETEVTLSGNTRVDCIGDTTAWEMDFSGKWAEAIGQSLFYATKTGLKPGIILICRKQFETCLVHRRRVQTVIDRWKLPISVWMHSGGLEQ